MLHVAGQVAVSSVSTSPLPYGTMASQCEALGLGSRKKLSSWLVNNGYDSAEDSATLDLNGGPHFPIQKVLCHALLYFNMITLLSVGQSHNILIFFSFLLVGHSFSGQLLLV